MTAKELAEQILQRIQVGHLDPNAVVVRTFCMCDEECGLIEAAHLDQVVRSYRREGGIQPSQRLYLYGSVEPSETAVTTVKIS